MEKLHSRLRGNERIKRDSNRRRSIAHVGHWIAVRVRVVTVRFVAGFAALMPDDMPGFTAHFMLAAAAHGREAGGAELGMFRLHAGGDLRHVGNEFRA